MGRAWSLTFFAGCLAVATAALFGDGALAGTRAVFAVFLLFATTVRLRRDPTITRGPWILIITGGLLALGSAVVRVTHGAIVGETNPYPSVAEIPAYLGYIFIIAAAHSFVRHRSPRRDLDAALDGFLVAAAAAVVVFSAIMSEYIRDSGIGLLDRSGNVAYTVLDILMIGYVARLALGPGITNIAWRLMAGASFLILLNDMFFLLDTTGTDWALRYARLASPLAFVCASAAILHPEVGDLAKTPTYTSPRLSLGRITALGLALLTLPGALLVALVRDVEPDLPVLVTGSVVLATLTLTRIALLFRAKEIVADLESSLTNSGRELLDASDELDIAVAVSRTIRLVVGEQARFVALVDGGRGGGRLVERADSSAMANIEPAIVDNVSPDTGPLADRLIDHLGSISDEHRVITLDLGDHAEYGRIVVEVPIHLEHALGLALQTLAAQIAQALASLRLAETRFERRTERRLTALVEQSADLVTVIDEKGNLSYVSPNSERVLGYSGRELVGNQPTEIVHPDDLAAIQRHIITPSQADASAVVVEGRLRTASDQYRWFDITSRDFRHDPEVGGVVVTARDITEERAAKLGLKRSEQWFRGLVQHSSDVIAVLDEAGVFTYASPAAEDLMGLRPDQLRGRNFLELLPTDNSDSLDRVRRAIKAQPPGVRNIELQIERPDRSRRTAEVTITNLRDDPSVQGLVLNVRDVTDRKRLEEDLRHQVLHDDLTGLGSRVQFTTQLTAALGPERRPGSRVAVLFIDVDDFKNINDSLGHAAGDQVLVEISSRLLGRLRLHDRAARFGGDEFAVVLTDVYGDSDITNVADRIIEELGQPVILDGQTVQLSVSVGIAVDDVIHHPTHDTGVIDDGGTSMGIVTPEDLLRAADVAMYGAKEQGKGRWAMFEAAMGDETVERFEIANRLGAAIDNDELMVYYQPIVDLGTGRTVGVEALVRWNHPERGMVSPAAFIPLAERNGLIVPLGRSVLRTAVGQVAEWRVEGHDIYASVNISAVQLQRDGIVAEVLEIVDSAGIERNAVVLELTESALIDDSELVVGRIDALRDAGLRVAIDDFGTGYATLKYAEEFSADILKIDQSFVARLEEHEESTIVSTVLHIAESMGAQTVAEGIEVPEQHRRLMALGCQLGQGYYFTRPAPAAAISDALRRELDGEALVGHSR